MTITQARTVTILAAGPAAGQAEAILAAAAARGGAQLAHPAALLIQFDQPAAALAALLDAGPPPVAVALAAGPAQPEAPATLGQQALDLLAAAHPGQIALTEAAARELAAEPPAGFELRELGAWRLADLLRAQPLFELRRAGGAPFPPLDAIDAHPNNLPLQHLPLIGRREEIADLRALLGDPALRLLTLRGTSGTGKTRLSLRVAAELAGAFADGVFFVSLAPVSDPALVASAIAHVLGVKERGGQALAEALASHLAQRRMLLLLDNFEQVAAAAPLLGDLLAAAPGLKLLVTSQAELGLAEERVFVLPPLALPELGSLPPLAELGAYPAIRLFGERMRAARPGFALTEANAPAVAELCARLMGLPLAIELATAHGAVFAPEEMLLFLRGRLALVKSGARLSSRAQVLRHVLDWSYNLLAPGEQALFARLGAFAGGCTLEAVEAVCDAEGDLPIDLLDGVNTLLNKHLLLQEELAAGELRYIMLDAVHEFAGKRLSERRESIKSRHRHADYFIQLAETAEPALRSAEQGAWLDRLEGEHHNLRAALRWTLANPDPERAICLSGALSRFWLVRGHLSEGRRWLEAALAKPSSASPLERAKAQTGLANLLNVQGEYAAAQERYEQSLALAREAGDRKAEAAVLANLGIVRYYQGDLAAAADFYGRSLAIARELGDSWAIASTLNNLGDVASERGEPARARALYGESLAVLRGLGEQRSVGIVLLNLGLLDYEAGDHASAAALLDESLALFRQLGERRFVAAALLHAGQVAAARSDDANGRRLLGEAVAIQRELGDRRGLVTSLEALAATVAAGQPAHAARLLGHAAAQRSALGAPLSASERAQVDQLDAALALALGPHGLAAARQAGAEQALDQALAATSP